VPETNLFQSLNVAQYCRQSAIT